VLADVGITVTYTDVGTAYVSDQLAQKYAAAVMPLQQDPAWQLINFKMSPGATWNMFKYSDPKVDELIATIHDAKTDADAVAPYKELNAYIVDQAWFAPWYRLQNNYALDKNTTTVAQSDNSYPYLWNFKPKA